MYRGRVYDTEIIELCVRRYITYRLSYRDLVAMMAERGVEVSHTTILRWVIVLTRRSRFLGSNWLIGSAQSSSRSGQAAGRGTDLSSSNGSGLWLN
jgi:hypothetical protein